MVLSGMVNGRQDQKRCLSCSPPAHFWPNDVAGSPATSETRDTNKAQRSAFFFSPRRPWAFSICASPYHCFIAVFWKCMRKAVSLIHTYTWDYLSLTFAGKGRSMQDNLTVDCCPSTQSHRIASHPLSIVICAFLYEQM